MIVMQSAMCEPATRYFPNVVYRANDRATAIYLNATLYFNLLITW